MGSDSFSTKLLCTILAILASVLIVVSVFGGASVGFIKSNSYVLSKFKNYNEQLVQTVNDGLLERCTDMTVPAEAFTTSFSSEQARFALSRVSNSVVRCYTPDFSDSLELYSCFTDGIGSYCKDNNIKISDKDLNACACYAVDVTNEILTSQLSGNIKMFQLSLGKSAGIIFIFCAIAAAIILIAIDLINRGRHKKISYIAMSFITSGLIFIAATVLVKMMKYIESFTFCGFEIYDNAIKEVLLSTLNIYPVIGTALVIIGIVMMIKNYNYFVHKKNMNEYNAQIKKDFIEHYNNHKKDVTE